MGNNFLKVQLCDSYFYSHFTFPFEHIGIMEQINSMLTCQGIEIEREKRKYGINISYSGKWEEKLDWFTSVFSMYGFEVCTVGMYF